MIMMILVGNTGFVGSNLCLSTKFDYTYNSQNITESYDTKPDILIYAGVTGTKFLANSNPQNDILNINNAIKNISSIRPNKLVLISTVDIFSNPHMVDEDTIPIIDNLCPYGRHRLILEKWVQENISDYLIVRLPGIYGENLKKNLIFDLYNKIPVMLTKDKMAQFDNQIKPFYQLMNDGYYHLLQMSNLEKKQLTNYFISQNFTSWHFTDSRAQYQYYNLKYLWSHIQSAIAHNLKILNISTEPVNAAEIIKYIFNIDFTNEIVDHPIQYNMLTKHCDIFGGNNGYIFDKTFCLNDLKQFINMRLDN